MNLLHIRGEPCGVYAQVLCGTSFEKDDIRILYLHFLKPFSLLNLISKYSRVFIQETQTFTFY
jgi:hypothetical protein